MIRTVETTNTNITPAHLAAVMTNGGVIRTLIAKPQSPVRIEDECNLMIEELQQFIKDVMGKKIVDERTTGYSRSFAFASEDSMWFVLVDTAVDTLAIWRGFRGQHYDAQVFKNATSRTQEIIAIIGDLK